MRRSRSIAVVALAAVAAVALAGCSIQIGWVSSSQKGSMSSRFAYFKGTKEKSIDLDAGEILTVDYSISLKNGTMTIVFSGPDGEISREEATQGDNTGTFSVEAPAVGRYTVTIHGDGAKGSYKVDLKV